MRASTSPAIRKARVTASSFIRSYTFIRFSGKTVSRINAGAVDMPSALSPFSVTSINPRPVRM